MNSSEIKTRAASMMSEALSQTGFALGRGALIHKIGGLWSTEFTVSIEFYVERIEGFHDIEPRIVIRLPYFEFLEEKFIEWQNGRNLKAKYKNDLIFYSHGFRSLYRSIAKTEVPNFEIEYDEELRNAVFFYASLVDREIGDWIQQWGDWSSARRLMDSNRSMAGAWRNNAYFALLRCGFGGRAACNWLDTDGPVTFSRRLSAQIEFLREYCAGDRELSQASM